MADPTHQVSNNSTGLETAVTGEIQIYLNQEFCRDNLCIKGDWQKWIIIDGENSWTVEELEMIQVILLTTIQAVNHVGADGHMLLTGYRIRKVDQDFIQVEGEQPWVAVTRHEVQEIVLSRTAFLRQHGFQIYHELGHVVDKRVGRRYTIDYQALAAAGGETTEAPIADGYWLREYGRNRVEEGSADAFAAWVVLRFTDNYQPVFLSTPVNIDYDLIINTAQTALTQALAAMRNDNLDL